jgi:hypothetical protein
MAEKCRAPASRPAAPISTSIREQGNRILGSVAKAGTTRLRMIIAPKQTDIASLSKMETISLAIFAFPPEMA